MMICLTKSESLLKISIADNVSNICGEWALVELPHMLLAVFYSLALNGILLTGTPV